MEYLHWKEQTIEDFSPASIDSLYNQGFVFTRIQKGVMHQTRSIRINLSKFEVTSENRRILRKGESIAMTRHPIPYSDYSWNIGKLAKDFYDTKAGGAFSANKIKEIITTEHNFNTLLDFNAEGFAICYADDSILHYSYPFYDLEKAPKDMGMIMMTKTIVDAQEKGLRYVYLGSLQRPTDTYKLQFSGVEWFDGKEWKRDIEEVKNILKQ
jgi:arginyl-tRNA--protein-N-Asp/Glu arginylyltransferase